MYAPPAEIRPNTTGLEARSGRAHKAPAVRAVRQEQSVCRARTPARRSLPQPSDCLPRLRGQAANVGAGTLAVPINRAHLSEDRGPLSIQNESCRNARNSEPLGPRALNEIGRDGQRVFAEETTNSLFVILGDREEGNAIIVLERIVKTLDSRQLLDAR